MPILLTTPFKNHPRVRIVRFEYLGPENRILVYIQYGDDVPVTDDDGNPAGTVWDGAHDTPAGVYPVAGADYDSMVQEVSLTDEPVYEGVKRVLYQWLIDEGYFAGTIV